ncbi:alpha/beta hydrolase [Citricoccus sp. I39-566]|uniref:alpha/beta fold hydrolase n=1 Tax=Citricoccus sp. I39-566 TaxID=3073268 RepID=UPI00286AF02B|nr:alpha/beta hydrolase [Citricoccus sp. I39-566]WMY78792.1 alpha/beta hydrolase [Citricoccus sp. I39-566]
MDILSNHRSDSTDGDSVPPSRSAGSVSIATSSSTPRRRPQRPGRGRRLLRWLGTGLLVVLVGIGLVATWTFFAGPPGVGHFRSAEGRIDYLSAYQDSMDRLPEPTDTHDLRTSHGTIRVYEWATDLNRGETPILLVPGRASGVPMWMDNLENLAGERRVLAFDALGDSGLSEQAVPFEEFTDQAHPIDDVVSALAPEGVHLMGHSFGGAVASAYAHEYPERTATLTLLDPVFTLANPSPEMLWWSVVASLPGLPDAWRETALEWIGGAEIDSEEDRDEPMTRMITAATAHYQAAVPQPSPLTDDQLERLSMPVYVALASRDSLAGGQDAVERAESLTDSTVKVWPDTTHSLPMQAAGELEPELLRFFADQDR